MRAKLRRHELGVADRHAEGEGALLRTLVPYLVFYVERPDHIDVWRVLHSQRDIPAWMQEPEGA